MVESSIHFERTATTAADSVRNSSVEYVFIVDPSEEDPFPGKKTIGRFYDSNETWLINQGAQGAVEWWARHEWQVRARPWLWGLVPCNEPSKEFPAIVNAYLSKWADIAASKFPLLRRIGPNFSNGNPEPHDAPLYASSLRKYYGLSFHEYWVPEHWLNEGSWVGWLMGRYANFMSYLPVEMQNMPVFITEYGCDGLSLESLGMTPVEKGWKTFYSSFEEYLVHIKRYLALLAKDSRVRAAFLYEVGAWPRWYDYELDGAQAATVLRLNAQPTPVPQPVPAPSVGIEQAIGDAAQHFVLPLNPLAALEKAGASRGLLAVSPEIRIIEGHVFQVFRDTNNRTLQHIAYCPDGDWGNIKWFTRKN